MTIVLHSPIQCDGQQALLSSRPVGADPVHVLHGLKDCAPRDLEASLVLWSKQQAPLKYFLNDAVDLTEDRLLAQDFFTEVFHLYIYIYIYIFIHV